MLKVHIKNLKTVTVMSLQGQIVNDDTEILRAAVHSQGSMAGVSTVILDLARVSIVDARGLGVMLELRELAEAKGIRFELMNVTKWVSRVLEISHLDAVFRITAGVEFFPSVSRSPEMSVAALASCA